MILQESLQHRSIIQEVNDPFLEDRGISLLVKRDDLIHRYISGNKWRKLKYNLQEAARRGFKKLLTFGGAYSNHIYAVAAAGKEFGFQTIGVIRGESYEPLNPTLGFAKKQDMHLHYVSRKNYKDKDDPDFIMDLKNRYGDFYLLPEGGSNILAVQGCAEIIPEMDISYDIICACCGTGGTLAGIISGLKNGKQVLGFSVLKGGGFLKNSVQQVLTDYGTGHYDNWDIHTEYHFGGYAKYTPELIRFINSFKLDTGIPIDPVYTGKMFNGIYDLVRKNKFVSGSTILAVHTGGLQGIKGFNQRFGDLIK